MLRDFGKGVNKFKGNYKPRVTYEMFWSVLYMQVITVHIVIDERITCHLLNMLATNKFRKNKAGADKPLVSTPWAYEVKIVTGDLKRNKYPDTNQIQEEISIKWYTNKCTNYFYYIRTGLHVSTLRGHRQSVFWPTPSTMHS